MNPNGAPMIHSAASAPTMPYGIAAKTMNGLIALLELEHQRQVDQRDRDQHHDGEVREALDLLLFLAADLQAIARRQLPLRTRSSCGSAASSTSDGSTPGAGNAETVIVRNWLRRCSFSVCISYAIDRDLTAAAPSACPAAT